jgi:hypothetical protein
MAVNQYALRHTSPQCLKKHPGLLQVGSVKPLREPAVHRRQELSCLGMLALALPQACQARGSAQLQGSGLLAAGDCESLGEAGFCFRGRYWQAKKLPSSGTVVALTTSVLGCGNALQAGCQIGCLANGPPFLQRTTAHSSHHHQPGMEAQAHGQAHPALSLQAGVGLAQGLNDPQPGVHSPVGSVVRLRIAEVHQYAITQSPVL